MILDQCCLQIDRLVVNLHPQMQETPSMSRFWQSWMFFKHSHGGNVDNAHGRGN